MCPFYFADRFSGAVVHLTTSNPPGLLFACFLIFTSKTGLKLEKTKTLDGQKACGS
jgi:hypothetical protein